MTTVLVSPPPSAPVISSNSPVCENNAIVLTADTIPGATYSWSGPNSWTSTDQNPVFPNASPAETGNYSVVASIGGCTSPSSSTNVIVNAVTNPTVFANGPTTFCSGDSVELMSSPGNSYLWSNSETTQSIWVTQSGTYTVNTVDANGCTGNSAGTNVTVNQTPVVTFTGLAGGYCLSNPAVTLTGSPAGGAFFGAGINGNTFDPAAAGTGVHQIMYSYTDPNGCSSYMTQGVSVSSNAYVNLGADTTICTTATLTINAGNFNNYTWQDNSNGSSFVVDGTTLGAGDYTFYVDVTDANGCTGTDSIHVNVSVCTGIDQGGDLNFSIIPNPADGKISIQHPGISGDLQIEILNLQGEVLQSIQTTNAGGAIQLDLSGFAQGIYYIRVSGGGQSGVQKIVIQH
jgi:large repetitive protein